MKFYRLISLLLVIGFIAGCASRGYRAPVVEGGAAKQAATVSKRGMSEKDWRPDVYVVQKGDTLYSIAFNHGFDYHELAELNRIADPTLISIGQKIHLFPGKSSSSNTSVPAKPIESLVKQQPKLVKYAYSEQALAQIDNIQKQQASPVRIAKVISKPTSKASVAPVRSKRTVKSGSSKIIWSMPADGKLIGRFSETANRKGIDIAGKLGQPIFASASGKVVYSGSGLRGYGKLIIIKHDKTYLSAYAHNDRILVKEGQTVKRGQKIAAMGKTDSNRVKLHFEVRRLGKPVDPAKYLQIAKS